MGSLPGFHLKTVADHQAFIPAPGPEIAVQRLGLARALGLERRNRQFHILRPIGARDQHRIGHRHRDQIPTSSTAGFSVRPHVFFTDPAQSDQRVF